MFTGKMCKLCVSDWLIDALDGRQHHDHFSALNWSPAKLASVQSVHISDMKCDSFHTKYFTKSLKLIRNDALSRACVSPY